MPEPADAGLPPVAAPYDGVVGQPAAVAHLRAFARRPVHAYLFQGPPGSGKRMAARSFAASLLCPDGGCGACNHCRRALAGTHPDLVTVERTGAAFSVDDARAIVTRAQRRPLEAARQVLVVVDVHLAVAAAPALLKTVEEPPPSTVFVLLADDVPVSLATIASRCVAVVFDPVPVEAVVAWLVGRGVDGETALAVATVSQGRLDRAALLATDQGFAERQHQWRAVPGRLDGTGAAVATVAAELLASAEGALGPVQEQHAAELARLAEQAGEVGAKGIPGRKEVEDRHHREERRWRTDELRMGLAVLAGAYGERLAAAAARGSAADGRHAAAAVDAVEHAARALGRNPNESLLLESLLVTLSGMGG